MRYRWEPRDALLVHDAEVLPTMRELYFKSRTVSEVEPLHLSGILKDEGYLDCYPMLADVGAAQGALLEAERVLDITGAA
jgi:hypothetical protein